MNTAQKQSLLHCSFASKTTMQQAPLKDATVYATTTQQPASNPASLLDLARNKLRNNHATSTEKTAQQAPSIVGEDVALETARHRRVAEMLSDNKIAVLVEDATTDPVVATVGIRGLATFDLHIPLSRYDGIALLQVVDQYASETDLNSIVEADPLPNAIELNQEPHSKPSRKVT